jgi:hypothetical protein
MTLLQRGVIQRLREAGYPALADEAKRNWSEECWAPEWHIENAELCRT